MSNIAQRAYQKGFDASWKAGGCYWAKHISESGDSEWVRAIFQDMPQSADMGGYESLGLEVKDTMPCIWVQVQEVQFPLYQWRHENSRADECGSRISICGEHYKVDSIDRNHRGRLKITLRHAGCCSEHDPPFDDELTALLCDEDVCIDLSEPTQPCPPVHCGCAPRPCQAVCKHVRPPTNYKPKMPWRFP